MKKNYIAFVNDHSGSMRPLANAALRDYNANAAAVRDAATKEKQDTIVSVISIGINGLGSVERTICNSNPHILEPMTSWPTPGNTPLYDAIGNTIELFKSLPDYNSKDVSFLVMITTDGEEYGSVKYDKRLITSVISEVLAEERWTFVARVPKGVKESLSDLGIPAGNIQVWETTEAGMAKSTVATAQGVDKFFAARSAGARSSSAFYADASQVTATDLVQKLTDVSSKVSLYVVPPEDEGIQIRDFILRHRMEYLKGAAFYQLTKTEARVQRTKLIVIRDRASGKMYSGDEARKLIGLPDTQNVRLHPGDHGNYDLFIQSESINRKLVGRYGVLYWKELGVKFTQEEIDRFTKPAAPKAPGVVVLPQVAPTNKPTKSPIPVTKRVVLPVAIDGTRHHTPGTGAQFFASRDEARAGVVKGLRQYDAGPGAKKGQRWFTDVAV